MIRGTQFSEQSVRGRHNEDLRKTSETRDIVTRALTLYFDSVIDPSGVDIAEQGFADVV